MIKSKNYTHKWVDIKLDNMRLIADGTTNYNGHQDIYNCKINDNTSGFVLIENSIPCASLEDLYKAGIIDDDYIETCCRLLLDGSNLFYCEKQQLLLGDVDYNEFKSNMTFVKKS